MRRTWWRDIAAAAAVGLAAVGLAACGVPTDDRASTAGADQVPFGLLEREPERPPATVPPPAASLIRIYLLDAAGERLVGVDRAVDAGVDVPVAEVVDALLLGPTRPESQLGLRTALSRGTISDVGLVGGVANVDLDADFAGLDGATQRLALAQAVYTLTSRPGVGRVAFTLVGQLVEVPRGDGTLTSGSVSRDSYRELAPSS
jgi:spore germination protein GerM